MQHRPVVAQYEYFDLLVPPSQGGLGPQDDLMSIRRASGTKPSNRSCAEP
jgi:hypothetical protein